MDFDPVIDKRLDKSNRKWNRDPEDILPFWIAEMDFLSPPVVTQALSRRIQAGLFGYEFVHQGLTDAIADWSKKRHHWNIPREWIYFFPGRGPFSTLFYPFFHRTQR